jgi:hypothetical protein
MREIFRILMGQWVVRLKGEKGLTLIASDMWAEFRTEFGIINFCYFEQLLGSVGWSKKLPDR